MNNPVYTAKIEQTYQYPKRMKYIPQTDSFVEKDVKSLSYERNVRQPYGWIKESGTPPCEHLDVYVMTQKEDMHRLYPREDPGEGWFGRECAEEIIKEFFSRKSPKDHHHGVAFRVPALRQRHDRGMGQNGLSNFSLRKSE